MLAAHRRAFSVWSLCPELRDTTPGLWQLPVGVKAHDFIRAPEIELMKSLTICSKKLVWHLLTPCRNFMCLFMLGGKQSEEERGVT